MRGSVVFDHFDYDHFEFENFEFEHFEFDHFNFDNFDFYNYEFDHVDFTQFDNYQLNHDQGCPILSLLDHYLVFASPAEIIRELHVYFRSHYGSMLWDLWGQLSTPTHGQLQSSWLGTAPRLQDLTLFRKSLSMVAPVQKQTSWLGSASSSNP